MREIRTTVDNDDRRTSIDSSLSSFFSERRNQNRLTRECRNDNSNRPFLKEQLELFVQARCQIVQCKRWIVEHLQFIGSNQATDRDAHVATNNIYLCFYKRWCTLLLTTDNNSNGNSCCNNTNGRSHGYWKCQKTNTQGWTVDHHSNEDEFVQGKK